MTVKVVIMALLSYFWHNFRWDLLLQFGRLKLICVFVVRMLKLFFHL